MSVGFLDFGSYLLGWRETNCYAYFDVPSDLQRNIDIFVPQPFIRKETWLYCSYDYVLNTFFSVYTFAPHQGNPYRHINVFYNYALKLKNDINCFYYINTQDILCFVESAFTNTPLVLKYPKYYGWERVPQILSPRFTIWSYYEIDISSINVYIRYQNAENQYVLSILNPMVHKDKVIVKRDVGNDKIYIIEAYFPDVIPPNRKVEIGISLQDVKGNQLKQGFW